MTSLSDYLDQLTQGELEILPLFSAAQSLLQANRPEDAVTLYKSWIEHRPSDPMLHAAFFNLGCLYDKLGQRELGAEAFGNSIRCNPDFPPPYINLGHYRANKGDRGGAAALWHELAERLAPISSENIQHKLNALKLLGRMFADADLDNDAEDALFRVIQIDPNQTDIMAYWLNMRQRQCKWDLTAPLPPDKRRLALEAMAPLTLISYQDDPIWQLANAAAFTQSQIGRPGRSALANHQAGTSKPRLKIGYLSSDLCEHAVGHLTVEVYGLHDRTRFEIFAYYTGQPTNDPIQQRIRTGVDVWRDIAAYSDDDAADLIAADGIDILVDLNGHTKDARLRVLARTPAPIIVNWLGYPGTMGSAFHHYIIADESIIPPGSEPFYSETVLRLPCYQPIDRQRHVASARPTRTELGLPDDAVVYCCFNEPRKITAETWDSWMRILAAVPDSVLWLLIPAAATRDRLRALAKEAGVSAERLIFADRRKNADHLARYPLADVVLDSFPYGAHTTASDALWMGVPVVTRQGKSFTSRVCASLLQAVGLPELVCSTPQEFIDKAIALGRDQAQRLGLRTFLRDRRDCVLFDTPRLVHSLESLYHRMWNEHSRGERPRPSLANMAVYNDVAIDLALRADKSGNDLETYRRALADRQYYTYLEADHRLWQNSNTNQISQTNETNDRPVATQAVSC